MDNIPHISAFEFPRTCKCGFRTRCCGCWDEHIEEKCTKNWWKFWRERAKPEYCHNEDGCKLK